MLKVRNPDSAVLHPGYIDCCLLGQEEKLTTKVPVRQSKQEILPRRREGHEGSIEEIRSNLPLPKGGMLTSHGASRLKTLPPLASCLRGEAYLGVVRPCPFLATALPRSYACA